MLSPEENKLFSSVGPGTPMGAMLRRYWHPVGCSELVTTKPQRIKVLGEELMVYRGTSGRTVLTQLRCAHRSLALDYGRVEGDSIRCPYHGWLYDHTGQCIAQPAEPEGSGFKEKVKLKTYPTQEVGGLVFGYMGPEPTPLLPLFDALLMEDGVKGVQMRNVNANWFNGVENIVDISHLAWLHGYTFPAYGAKKVTYHWDRAEYGMNNVMLVDGVDDDHISCYAFPTVNRFSAPPVDDSG
jgi:5,5'-dehydrodivanillate O-demethylase oxygenase subunit